jgi:hypothetical protein
LAVGQSGTRFYSAKTCTQRWSIATGTIPSPQVVQAAWLNGPSVRSSLFVQEKAPDQDTRKVWQVTAGGSIVGSYREPTNPTRGIYQTANVDGVDVKEDRVAAFGYLIGDTGAIRLDTGWYWGQQQLTANERNLIAEEQWTFNPLVFDLNRDGRDEIVVWGRHALVIGESN